MKFGVTLPNFVYGAAPDPGHLRRIALAAEETGYASIWASDHILVPAAFPRYGILYEAFVTLAWLAAQVPRLQIGTSILVLPMRHAVLAAKQAATLDRLSGGRLVLGVGVGWNEGEFRNVGADFHRRGKVLDESIAVLRNLFAGGTASFDGQFYAYRDGISEPTPERPGGPPIWIGGQSEAALRRAAMLADAWHGDDVTPDEFARLAAQVRQDAARVGRTVTGNVRLTVDMFRATGTARATGPTGHVSTGGTGALGMKGSFDDMRAAARHYREAGATDLVCQFEHDTPDQHEAFARMFAREVIAQI